MEESLYFRKREKMKSLITLALISSLQLLYSAQSFATEVLASCELEVTPASGNWRDMESDQNREIPALIPNQEWREPEIAKRDVELKAKGVSVWVRHLWACSLPAPSNGLSGPPKSLLGCQRHLQVIRYNAAGKMIALYNGDQIDVFTTDSDGATVSVRCSAYEREVGSNSQGPLIPGLDMKIITRDEK